MDLAPQGALGYAELSRELGIESPLAGLLHQRVAQRARATVIHGKGNDGVILPLDPLSGLELGDLQRK